MNLEGPSKQTTLTSCELVPRPKRGGGLEAEYIEDLEPKSSHKVRVFYLVGGDRARRHGKPETPGDHPMPGEDLQAVNVRSLLQRPDIAQQQDQAQDKSRQACRYKVSGEATKKVGISESLIRCS